MFKKFKDKLGEEFKQSPSRISASVQQLAQAISPNASSNQLNSSSRQGLSLPLSDAVSIPSDFFSIGDEQDSGESSKTLHNVDLSAASPIMPNLRSRRSSISSLASDVSSIFPIHESPLTHYGIQSDFESEIEEGISAQLEKISKEHLYSGYRKLLYRKNKYKGRYIDLAKNFKDLQHENIKTKNILQETQDIALRKSAELREQSLLEQKAKAHLEESLRNDLEERDHIIETLKTKIDLLKHGTSTDKDEVTSVLTSNASVQNEEELRKNNQELLNEIEKLKKKIVSNGPSIEPVISEQVKEKITELKSGIVRMKSDNESISNLLSKSPSTSETGDDVAALIDFSSPETDEKDAKINKLNNLLLKCKQMLTERNSEIKSLKGKIKTLEKDKEVIETLSKQIDEFKLREEENILSVAENKKAIHIELEAKEQLIKQLTKDLEYIKGTESELKKVHEEEYSKKATEILRLTEQISKMTAENEELHRKLQLQLPIENAILSTEFVEKQKELCTLQFQTFLSQREEALNNALITVQTKLKKAEENIMRNCADQLVSSRSAELELQQKITDMENKLTDGAIAIVQVSDLEKLIKDLEINVGEKEAVIAEKDNELLKVNEELSDKIDRIVELGQQLEDEKERSRLRIDSLDGQVTSFNKAKQEADLQLKKLHDTISSLTKDKNTLQANVSTLKTERDNVTKEKDDILKALNRQIEELTMEKRELVSNLAENIEQKESSTSHYVERIKELKAEIQSLKVDALNSSSSIAALEKTKTDADALHAAQFNEKCTELQNLQASLEAQMKKNKTVADGYTNQIETLLADKAILEHDILSIKENIERLNDENVKIVSDSKESFDCMKNDYERKVEDLQKENILLKEKLENQCNALATLESQKTTDSTNAQLQSEAKENIIESLNSEIQRLTESEKTYLAEANTLRTNLTQKSLELTELEQKLSDNSSVLTNELNVVKKEMADLQHGVDGEKKGIKEEIETLKDALSQKNKAVDDLMQKIQFITTENQNNIDKYINELNMAKNEMDILRTNFEETKLKAIEENESKINILKNEIKFLNEKFEQEVANIDDNREREIVILKDRLEESEKMAKEMIEKLEIVAAERDEVKVQFEEKSLKASELESCLEDLKSTMDRNFNDTKDSKAGAVNFANTVKQLEVDLAERDARIDELELQLADNKKLLENLQVARQDLKTLRKEVKDKDDLIDIKVEEIETLKKETDNRLINSKIDFDDVLEKEKIKGNEDLQKQKFHFDEALSHQKREFEQMLTKQKTDFENEIEKVQGQREQYLKEEKRKYEEKVKALKETFREGSREWIVERKSNADLECSPIVDERVLSNESLELESTSKVAIAAVESSTGSIELLRKEVMQQAEEMKELKKQHKREVLELQKLAILRSRRASERERDGEDIEYEYLRNILYEYMMGREQMVLAKVLAAIVKFDSHQTHNILERQATVGNHLRLL